MKNIYHDRHTLIPFSSIQLCNTVYIIVMGAIVIAGIKLQFCIGRYFTENTTHKILVVLLMFAFAWHMFGFYLLFNQIRYTINLPSALLKAAASKDSNMENIVAVDPPVLQHSFIPVDYHLVSTTVMMIWFALGFVYTGILISLYCSSSTENDPV